MASIIGLHEGASMRDRFPWYFVEKTHYEEAWSQGILTIDANVILDLYRYNKATREALLQALESFKGRLWISHQTALEFIKNRRSVILDVFSDFEKSNRHLEELIASSQKVSSSFKGLRAIPKNISDELLDAVKTATETARVAIEKEKSLIPSYDVVDEVVLRLEGCLDGNIGGKPDDMEDAMKEAERRKKQEIPPGYKDSGKEGDGFAGDYLMWRQILAHGKKTGKPVILVTSEQKEDWWEQKSGRTLNARRELLEEAFNEMGQRLFLYHTDRFLQLHQERTAGKLNEEVLEDIREISRERERAVRSVQEVDASTGQINRGRMRVTLLRSVRNFTTSGKFEPNLETPPSISVRLIDGPDDLPDVTVHANTGTTFDFNIHLMSGVHQKLLPEGEYVLEYDAASKPPAE